MAEHLTVNNALLREVKRTRKGGTAKLTFPVTDRFTKKMGWPELPSRTKGWTPEDSDLRATLIELTPNNDELVKFACTIDSTLLSDFQIVSKKKKEGKGSVKSADKITEVLCIVSFSDSIGAAKLEQYMQNAARSKMRVTYDPEPEQEELPGTRASEDDSQMPLATAEQQEAIADMTDEEKDSLERPKRGRPRKDVQ